MAKTMTPSATEVKKVTDRQINKAVEQYRALLEKHAPEFDSESFQLALGQAELTDEQFAVLRRRVEALSNQVTRRVKVDRLLEPQAMLDATGRKQYTDRDVVKTMPRGEGEEVEVVFFKIGRYVTCAELMEEYKLRGLVPADPYSLAAVNHADPAFADEKPNGTQWQDEKGNYCCAAFVRWLGERSVGVHRNRDGWSDVWWFAGVRK